MAKTKISKRSISKRIRYTMTNMQLERLQGRQNGFVFDIRSEIEYLDFKSGGKFDSRVYSPLVHEPIPHHKRGTIAYDDFWDEQDERCLYGYAPVVDGIQYPRITGPHYFYLNNYKIMKLKAGHKRKTLDYPDYRALDHMIFLELEKAEKLGYGIIVGKARRMGLSYIGSIMVLWHLIFFKHNTVAVGAGKDDKAKALFSKMKKSMENLREEYQVSYQPRKDDMKLAYKETVRGIKRDAGIQSELDVRTFFSDASAFEGGSYSFFIFEEIGIHDNLIASYKASEPCFTEGAIQFGVPFLFGTGGEVEKGSKDFKLMFDSPQSYNLKKIFIPKYLYYPGREYDKDELKGMTEMERMDVGVNFFDSRTGLNDEKGALKHILKRRDMARKSKAGYVKECQSYPIKESDVFLKTSGGKLDRLALSAQRESVYNNENGYKVLTGRYEWKDTDDVAMQLAKCRSLKEKNLVRIKYQVGVKFVEDINGPVRILEGIYPINNEMMPYNADIIGVDSYDDEEPSESGSKGSSLVYRCFNGMAAEYNIPIAVVCERGDATSNDSFFDNCLKQSVYWRAESLIEYTKTAVLRYFKDVYAHHYLRGNPDINKEIVTNKGRQEYGVRMTPGIKGFKSLVTTLLQIEVAENVQNIHFEEILDDLIDYGDKNTDIGMAYGVALIHKLDLFDFITEDLQNEVHHDDVLRMNHYGEDEEGNLVILDYGQGQDLENDIPVWDHREHFSPEERENYINFVKGKEEQIAKEREKKKKAYELSQIKSGDPFKSIVDEFTDKNLLQ